MKMNKRLLPVAIMLSSSLAFIGSAHALSTLPTPLNVTASISPWCSVTTSGVNFGTVSGTTPTPGSGNVFVNCSLNTTYTIALDAGSNYDTVSRRVTDGVQFIGYDLVNPATSQLWGDSGTTGATNAWSPVTGTGNGLLPVPHPINATLYPALVSPATFSDIVNVTVFY